MEENLISEYLRVANKTFKKLDEELIKLGLYRGQPSLIMVLYKNEGVRQKELCEKLSVTPATMTKMVNRMEKSGFIVKKIDSEDLRVSRIFLTEKAHSIKNEIFNLFEEFDKQCFLNIKQDEKEIFQSVLFKIVKNLS
ncbi:MarR family winged helix-turn-helix transcriptional regulator [Clostridium senegalense]|uniref:MarR family winged helix-turn-helix transcriptional regulator n=1 Tax=Clostridium senegalense TaxID=1465809 RepID=UPI001C11F4FD|nr:MarR family transcriptional regulator [Clostridium senegalense]MBU5225845.1 MarR family transcriptional regulator [Clostridium senegalense]